MSSIVFRRSGSGVDSDVWRIGPLGESPAPLLAIPGHQLYPSWSPDMTLLLFTLTFSLAVDSDRGVFTARPDGSELTARFDAPGSYDAAPVWSRDGARIAFESNADPLGTNPERDMEVFVMAADGAGVRQLTINALHDEGPSWAPDATMLAYSSGVDNAHVGTHLMTTDGEHLRRVNDDPGRDESPDWQAIPAPDTNARCGSLLGGVIHDVRVAGLARGCGRARSVARHWAARGEPARLGGFDAQVTDVGGTRRVELRDRRRPSRLAVFLAGAARDPRRMTSS